MRAEGPKERPTICIVVVVLCVGALRVQKAANMAQVEEHLYYYTLWCVVIYGVGLGLL